MDAFPDWDMPVSQEELDEIDAAFQNASSIINQRKRLQEEAGKGSSSSERSVKRRLPDWGIRKCAVENKDWDKPISQEALKEIDAVFQNASSIINQRKQLQNDAENGSSSSEGSIKWKLLDWGIRKCTVENKANLKLRYPALKFRGRIVYCRTVVDVEKATRELLDFAPADKMGIDPYILGFDIEWKPTFTRGEVPRKAAVMQICGNTNHCYVMHIIHSGIPPILQALLENPAYLKVGVCIANDSFKVMRDYNVCVKPLGELSGLANQCLPGSPIQWSLAALTETLTCKELEKPNKIRLGNWEAEELSKDQLEYAATDAFASWHLYQVLKSLQDLSTKENMEEIAVIQAK